MEDRLYTTQEVAQELGVSDGYIRKLIMQGKAQPKQQVGGTWLFSQEEVDRLRNRPKSKGGRPKK